MHANASIGQPHEVRHGHIINVGVVVHVFLGDAEASCGGGLALRARADRKIHYYLIIDDKDAALARKVNFHMAGTFRLHLGIILPDEEGARVARQAGEGSMIGGQAGAFMAGKAVLLRHGDI